MAASLTEHSWCVLELCGSSMRVPIAIWTLWSSWDVDLKVVWTRVEETRAHSEENSTETTAVLPIQTATGTKYSNNLNSPCITLSPIIYIWQKSQNSHYHRYFTWNNTYLSKPFTVQVSPLAGCYGTHMVTWHVNPQLLPSHNLSTQNT
jgi:hypothetical protein